MTLYFCNLKILQNSLLGTNQAELLFAIGSQIRPVVNIQTPYTFRLTYV
jgi:hypothetical protein